MSNDSLLKASYSKPTRCPMRRFVVVADGRDVDGEAVEPRNPIDTTFIGVRLRGYPTRYVRDSVALAQEDAQGVWA